jgi:hypothetical protein
MRRRPRSIQKLDPLIAASNIRFGQPNMDVTKNSGAAQGSLWSVGTLTKTLGFLFDPDLNMTASIYGRHWLHSCFNSKNLKKTFHWQYSIFNKN